MASLGQHSLLGLSVAKFHIRVGLHPLRLLLLKLNLKKEIKTLIGNALVTFLKGLLETVRWEELKTTKAPN